MPRPSIVKSRRAVVAGAGIAGLTAAYRLQQAGWEVEVFEAEPRAGGRVETVVQHGYCVDTGATAFAARYPVATQLAKELDLRIVETAPYLGVYRDGRVRLLRLDRLIRSGLRTDVLSLSTKLRLARVVFDVARASLRAARCRTKTCAPPHHSIPKRLEITHAGWPAPRPTHSSANRSRVRCCSPTRTRSAVSS